MSDDLNKYWKHVRTDAVYELLCLAGYDAGGMVSSLWIFKPRDGSLNVAFSSQYVTHNMFEISTEEALNV